ncbi:PucR family transcriptional regulator [Nocardia sp. NPDC055165]
MLTIDENHLPRVYSEDATAAAALNRFAMAMLSGRNINLGIARHFQIPVADTFVVVAAAFSANPDAATIDRPAVVADAWLMDIRRCLAAECGFPVPALLGPTYGTILIPASSVLGRRINDLLPLLSVAAPHPVTAVAVETATESISEAAATAHELLDLAVRLHKEPDLYFPDQLAMEYQITRPGPGRDQLVSVLEPLHEHPELIDTVAELVRQDFDRHRTARRLCIHPNTIYYRMRRLSALTGLPLTHSTYRRLSAALTAQAFVRAEHGYHDGSGHLPTTSGSSAQHEAPIGRAIRRATT